jgi:chloramphenicol O-acetyltransferase type A
MKEWTAMRKIDINSWPRRKHFEVYRQFDFPHFNLTFPVDVTGFYTWVKGRGDSYTLATAFLLSSVANEIAPFRLRIRGDEVIEHELVHPSFTVLLENELFSFCTVEFLRDYESFHSAGERRIEEISRNPTLEDEPGQDDLLFMTSLPWVHFTGLMHPIQMHPVDSVPRIAWGRIDDDDGKLHMPLSVQVHHALMDGLHVGRYAQRVQHLLHHPEELISQ